MNHLRATPAEVEETRQVGVAADRAVEWLRALSETWQQADVPQARSELVHAIYERIVIAGRDFVSARLAPAAKTQVRHTLCQGGCEWRARQDSDTR